MRKIIISICCVFMCMFAHAQQWSLGPKVGVNLSNNIGEIGGHYYKPGLTVGVFGEYRLKNVAVEADLLYSLQGFLSGGDAMNQNYLILPLKLKIYLPFISSKLYLYLGPQLDMLLGDAPTGLNGGGNMKVNRVQISLATGVGYKICDRFDLSFNYNYGSKVFKDRDWRNSVFNLSLGFDLFK